MRVEPAPKDLSLEYLYSVCCKDTPDNQIVEAVYQRFPDEKIVIWCHEEGRLVPLYSFCETRMGEDFAGPLLICGTKDSEEGEVNAALTDKQVEMVQRFLNVLPKPILRAL